MRGKSRPARRRLKLPAIATSPLSHTLSDLHIIASSAASPRFTALPHPPTALPRNCTRHNGCPVTVPRYSRPNLFQHESSAPRRRLDGGVSPCSCLVAAVARSALAVSLLVRCPGAARPGGVCPPCGASGQRPGRRGVVALVGQARMPALPAVADLRPPFGITLSGPILLGLAVQRPLSSPSGARPSCSVAQGPAVRPASVR